MDERQGAPGVRTVPPGGGEVIGDAPDRRVEILADVPELRATWSRFGPGRAGADLHVHRRHRVLFYVLTGESVLLLGPEGAPVRAAPGTLAVLPPLVVHGVRRGRGRRALPEPPHAGRGLCGLPASAPGWRVTERVAQEGITMREVPTDGTAPLPARPAPDRGVLAAYVLEGEAAGSWVQAPPGVALVLPPAPGRPAAVLEIHAG